MLRQLAVVWLSLGMSQAAEPLRRLTHSQYNNTVRDLLGDQTSPANRFPPEDMVNGFRNQVQAQTVSPLLAEAYGAAAERLARTAFRGGDIHGLVPCKPSGPSDRACAAKFVEKFGRRAYRRPLTGKEAQRLTGLLEAEALAARDFYSGARGVVEAILQSPNFLYRDERSGSGFARASRLAFYLWDTAPDEALLEIAARGGLETGEGVEKVAREMAADPRVRQCVDEFVSQWLRFDLLLGTVKDRRVHPQFTPELALAMSEEARRLIHHLVWDDRDFTELFTANFAFLNSELAQLYRLPAPKAEYGRVDFPASSERAGLLGQAAFLALTAKPGDSSPTARGIFVRERLLCQHIPDPPPGVDPNLPPVTADNPRSNRDRLLEHVSNPACKGCHSMIDPVGFAFEKFDAIGQYRPKLKLTFLSQFGKETKSPKPTTAEVELDTSGTLGGGVTFASPRELGAILAADARCQECVVRQLFRYAAGRHETPSDRPLIESTAARFRATRFRFRELMITIAIALTTKS